MDAECSLPRGTGSKGMMMTAHLELVSAKVNVTSFPQRSLYAKARSKARGKIYLYLYCNYCNQVVLTCWPITMFLILHIVHTCTFKVTPL